jgi:hypothetical protein
VTRDGSSPTTRIGAVGTVLPKAALDPARLVVTLTLGELTELVREAALQAVADLAEPAPALLDRAALARELRVSTGMVDRLRHEGLPVIWLGASPRFELAACVEWLRARGGGQP